MSTTKQTNKQTNKQNNKMTVTDALVSRVTFFMGKAQTEGFPKSGIASAGQTSPLSNFEIKVRFSCASCFRRTDASLILR